MMFVGGSMHGKPVPLEAMDKGVNRVDVLNIDKGPPFTVEIYVRTPWFVAVGKPLPMFYVLKGADPEVVIDAVRRMLPTC